MNRRRSSLGVAAVVVLLAALVGCQGGTPSIFGYQIGPGALYDPNIKTVYVPTFNNRAFQTTPYRGMEVDITRAVVREIGTRTTFKVVSDPDRADTELLGNLVSISKTVLNSNQQNLIREEEIVINADVLWRDLRTGRNLCAPRSGANPNGGPAVGLAPPPDPVPFDPTVSLPPVVLPDESILPIRLVATGRVLPELGESVTTGQQKAVDQLARQIVAMMEKPWGLQPKDGR